jgi:hypothetical protein
MWTCYSFLSNPSEHFDRVAVDLLYFPLDSVSIA